MINYIILPSRPPANPVASARLPDARKKEILPFFQLATGIWQLATGVTGLRYVILVSVLFPRFLMES
jgi:hypothetical protein